MRYATTISIIALIMAIIASGGMVLAASQGFNVSLEVGSPVNAYVKWAIPEGRVGTDGTNWDTIFFITVKSSDGVSTLYTMPSLATTDTWGRYLTPINLATVPPGTYDIFIKGHHSLTRKMDNVTLTAGLNRLNFTQADNSTATGTIRLLAGDISGSTSSPATMGDDVVNSVDVSIILTHIDENDPSNRDIRANINQDPVVNSVDLSLMLNNLDKEGDQ